MIKEKLIISNIKNLKISSSYKTIKMSFSLLNDLEALILYHIILEIYSTPKEADIFELKKLKYLKLI